VNLVAIDPTMGFIITLFLLLVSLPAILFSQEINFANIVVNDTTTIGETDDNYICATIGCFPSDTCRYNYCMLQNSSAITLVSVYIYIYIYICPLSSTFIQHGLNIYICSSTGQEMLSLILKT
jgi:hypothetical protein